MEYIIKDNILYYYISNNSFTKSNIAALWSGTTISYDIIVLTNRLAVASYLFILYTNITEKSI